MPVRIGRRHGTRLIELGDVLQLLGCQPTAPEILSRLLFSARADDHVARPSAPAAASRSAICGTVLPISPAAASSASTARYRYSSGTGRTARDLSFEFMRLVPEATRLTSTDLADETRPAERAPDDRAHLVSDAPAASSSHS